MVTMVSSALPVANPSTGKTINSRKAAIVNGAPERLGWWNSMTGFADHMSSRMDDMDNCLVCSSPTRSHLILIAYNDETGDMEAVDTLEDADGFGTVCHGCYQDADGDAEVVMDTYNAKLDEILEVVGVSKERLAQDPDEVDGWEYACSACGETVAAADVVEHRDEHDDVAVTFTRADLTDDGGNEQ